MRYWSKFLVDRLEQSSFSSHYLQVLVWIFVDHCSQASQWLLTMFHSTTEYPGNSNSATGLILNENFEKASIGGRPEELALSIRLVKD